MKLSVAIATWNRAVLLDQTLQSLTRLRVGSNTSWEVLVCDNNSTDQTRRIVERWNDQPARPWPGACAGLTYLFEPEQGKSFALNQLVMRCSGDWILFLDDDVLVDPGWLESYEAGIERHRDAACLGGPIEPWLDAPPHGRKAFLLDRFPAMYGVLEIEQDRSMDRQWTAWGANMALRREVLPPEPFDVRRGMIGQKRIASEDVGVILNLLDQGHAGWLIPGARVKHYIPSRHLGVRRFWSWHVGLGRTWVLTRGKAAPGKFGVPWWAWRELGRRFLRTMVRWRPWPHFAYYDALKDTAQYFGYVTAGE